MKLRTRTIVRNFSLLSAVSWVSVIGLSTGSPLTYATEPAITQQVQQYGPTKPTDTFWRIATNTRPDNSVSVYQMMAALFAANPHAFAADNYNSLEKNMILTIPPKSVIAAIPAREAIARAAADDQAWKTNKQALLRAGNHNNIVANSQRELMEQQTQLRQQTESLNAELAQANGNLTRLRAENLNLETQLLSLTQEIETLRQQPSESNDEKGAELSHVNSALFDLEQELLAQNELMNEQRQQIALLEQQLQQPMSISDENHRNSLWPALGAAGLVLMIGVAGLMFWRRPKENSEALRPVAPLQSDDTTDKADVAAKDAVRLTTTPASNELELDLDPYRSEAVVEKNKGSEEINDLLDRLVSNSEMLDYSQTAPITASSGAKMMSKPSEERELDETELAVVELAEETESTLEQTSAVEVDHRLLTESQLDVRSEVKALEPFDLVENEAAIEAAMQESLAAIAKQEQASYTLTETNVSIEQSLASLSNIEQHPPSVADSDFIDIAQLLEGSDKASSVESYTLELVEDEPEVTALSDDEPQNKMHVNLDLAQTYLEMDDKENAKALLDEVLREGDAEQQAQAQVLMQRLV